MKQFFIAAILLITHDLHATTSFTADPIVDRFMHTFPLAEKVKWTVSDSFYEVSFQSDQVTCRMWFYLDGTIERTMRYYKEDHLPPFVLAKITKKYPDKNVFGITEVTSEDGITYNIILEDEMHWIYVQSDAIGNVVTTNRYNKQKPHLSYTYL